MSSFSQRLKELSKNQTPISWSTLIKPDQNEVNEIAGKSSAIDCKETDDVSTWGHAFSGETYDCAASGASAGHFIRQVQGRSGANGPCRSVRDVSTMTDDLIPVTPTLAGTIRVANGGAGPMVIIGYKAGETVYRTTTAVATALQGERPGLYHVHEPALFPNTLIVDCGLTQADVTVRTTFCSPLSSMVDHNFEQEQESHQDFDTSPMASIDDQLSNNSHGDDINETTESCSKCGRCGHMFL